MKQRRLQNEDELLLAIQFSDYFKRFSQKSRGVESDPFIKSFPRVKIKVGDEKKITVFDATCGIGQDSFRLLMQGYDVIACERNEKVYNALGNALDEALKDEKIKKIVEGRFSLRFGDAKTILSSLDNLPEIIYFDPMYGEQKGRTALARKEMQIFHQLVGKDEDASRVLEEMINGKLAKDKIVVKRPLKSDPLYSLPSYQLKGKSTRFDVYKIFF